jgi:hypothetical protein
MRRLKRDQDPPSPFVFKSERGAPSRRRDGARWWRGWAPRLATFRRKIENITLAVWTAAFAENCKLGRI